MQESPTSLVPIGADCYVRAKPLAAEPGERLVAISVGFGFFCEMKPDEGIVSGNHRSRGRGLCGQPTSQRR